jgi:hypothetical protein
MAALQRLPSKRAREKPGEKSAEEFHKKTVKKPGAKPTTRSGKKLGK